MKALLCAVPLMLAVFLGSASATEVKPADAKPPAGTEGTWMGTLGASQGAGLGVVHVKPDKNNKDGPKQLVLYAEDKDVKNSIATLLAKHTTVSVSGLLATDNTSVKVTSINEEKPAKKGKN
ncbi:MAG TPA: hypothetical protein VKX17_28345 [Planctomycetota bacterium]|nr:hypothetical protein [Planctomycetota bacterium]